MSPRYDYSVGDLLGDATIGAHLCGAHFWALLYFPHEKKLPCMARGPLELLLTDSTIGFDISWFCMAHISIMLDPLDLKVHPYFKPTQIRWHWSVGPHSSLAMISVGNCQ